MSEFEGLPIDTKVMRAATDKIMGEVTTLLAKLRGTEPPAEPYHPAKARRQFRTELRQLAEEEPASGDPTTEVPEVPGS